MKVIYKYPVTSNGTVITAPFDQILDIQYQDGIPMIWAIVDTERFVDVVLTVYILPTGLPFEENPGTYFRTLQDDYGYVWHFFLEMKAVQAMTREVSGVCH